MSERTCRKCAAIFSGRACTACAKQRAARWYIANADITKARAREWKVANPNHYEIYRERKIAQFGPSFFVERTKRWRVGNWDKYLANEKCARESLSNRYIARRFGLKQSELPGDLMDAKRIYLKIQRLLKDQKK